MPKNSTNDPEVRETASEDTGATPMDAPAADSGDINEVLREKAALQDRLLRTAAEFDNYRKRVDRERRELSEYAAADVLTDVIAIVDDFERALQVPTDSQADAYRQGIELIHKQMLD